MSGLIRHLTISQSHVFLVNSRLCHFSAPYSRRVPLCRSYGVNLPSSLAMIHSNTSGYSPHPPVSVYGTGRNTLSDRLLFLQVGLPALSIRPKPHGTFDFQSPYGLKPSIPSDGGSVTAWSQPLLHCEYWNINQLVIRFPSRVLLSPRLTLIRLTLFRKPGVCGVNVSTSISLLMPTFAFLHAPERLTSHLQR